MDPAATLIKRFDRLAVDRAAFENTWQKIADVTAPHRGSFVRKNPTGRLPDILDTTGVKARRILAAALHAMLTNPAQAWFGLAPEDEHLRDDRAAMVWLGRFEKMIYAAFAAPVGNFNGQITELYDDLAAFGTGGLYVADAPGRGVLFSSRPLRELFLAENDEGRIDTVFRRFKLTARVAVDRWSKKAGAKVAAAAGDPAKEDDEFEFLHAVYPRRDRDRSVADRRHFALASCWIGLEDKTLIDEGGYHEMPYMTPRWEKGVGQVYGSGSGELALGDLNMLQRAMSVTIGAAEQSIKPSLMVADDGVMGTIDLRPSALTTVRADMLAGSGSPIRPILTGARPDLGEEFMAGIRSRANDAFYWNLLQLMRDPKMTATQVLALQDEVLRIMGPVLGRQATELLDPMIERVGAILLRAGALPPPPPALQGRKIRARYEGPVTRAQRGGEAQAIVRAAELRAQVATLDPSVVDNFDLDAEARRVADLIGYPKDLLRPPEQVQAMRQARAKEKQADADLQRGGAAADGAAKIMQAMPAMRDALAPAASSSVA